MANCKKCNSNVVSKFELDLETCLECVKKGILSLEQKDAEISALSKQVEEISSKKEILSRSYQKLHDLYDAEKQGYKAAANGLDPDQNPFLEKDENLSSMWAYGWISCDKDTKLGQNAALVRWASDTLAVVHDLAAGYGHEEIAIKIKLVKDKLESIL